MDKDFLIRDSMNFLLFCLLIMLSLFTAVVLSLCASEWTSFHGLWEILYMVIDPGCGD
jgi:hypothetical protein